VDGEPAQVQKLRIKHGGPNMPASPSPVDPIAGVAFLGSPGGGPPTHLRITSNTFVYDEKGHYYSIGEAQAHDAALSNTDRLVAAFPADVSPGTLNEKLGGDGMWISTTTEDLKVKVQHVGPGDAYPTYAPSPPSLSLNGTSLTATVSLPTFDEKGHRAGATDKTSAAVDLKMFNTLVGAGNAWIHVEQLALQNGTLWNVSHVLPETPIVATETNLLDIGTGQSWNLTYSRDYFTFDTLGHLLSYGTSEVLGSVDLPEIATSSDDWIDLNWNDANTVLVAHHQGPNDTYPTFDPTPPALSLAGAVLTLTRPFPRFDMKGHKSADGSATSSTVDLAGLLSADRLVAAFSADGSPGTLDEKLDGDGTWITVSNDVANLRVKVEHAGPGEYADFYDPDVDVTYDDYEHQLEIGFYKGKFDAKGHLCDQGEQSKEIASLAAATLTFNEMRISGGKLQQRTRTIRFIGAVEESEPSWTDLYEIGECQ